MTNSILLKTETGTRGAVARVAGNAALHCMYDAMYQCGKRLHTLPSHPTLDEPQAGFWLKMLTDRERKEHIRKNRKSSSHKHRIGWEETGTEVELGQNSQKLK